MENNNMDVDTQSCQPDSTVNIVELDRQPPAPTPLDIVRHSYRQHQLWCAEMLANCMQERGQIRHQLLEVQQRRRLTLEKRKIIQQTREATAQATKTVKAQLIETTTKCNALLAEYEEERAWQPSVTLTDQEMEELKARVATMRQTLVADIQSKSKGNNS